MRKGPVCFACSALFGAIPLGTVLPAVAASYRWPVTDRWRVGVGGFLANEMIDDAPVVSPSLPVLGSVSGRFTDRGTMYLRGAVSFGPNRG